MPIETLLGATGGTGAAVLRALRRGARPDLTLNVVVRSKDKLLKTFPDLEDDGSLKLGILQADLDDFEAMKTALRGTEVIYSCIASNTSTPGMTVAVDAAQSILKALRSLKQEQGSVYKAPTVLMLRSLNVNESHAGSNPVQNSWNPVILGLKYLYADLDEAAKLYSTTQAEEPGLIQCIIVDPVSLHDPDGTELTGYKLSIEGEAASMVLSYADLGAAFCEVAQVRNSYIGKAVAVSGTGHVKQSWPPLLNNIAQGYLARMKAMS